MDKLNWIKDLVLAEQKMEETGVVDISAGFDPEGTVEEQTVDYMKDLKSAFLECATVFNQMKGSSLGAIKIYGISKTKCDFMLFRNGFKLVYSMKQPGRIAIRFNTLGASFLPGQAEGEAPLKEDLLEAGWGAFGELKWTFKEQVIHMDYLVRYYMTRFIKESSK